MCMLGACGYGRGDDRCGDGDDAQPFSCTQVALVLVGSRRGGGGGRAAIFWGLMRKSSSSSALRGRARVRPRKAETCSGAHNSGSFRAQFAWFALSSELGRELSGPFPSARTFVRGGSLGCLLLRSACCLYGHLNAKCILNAKKCKNSNEN